MTRNRPLRKPPGPYLGASTDTVSNAFSFDSDNGLAKRSRRDSANLIGELEQRACKGGERGAGRICVLSDHFSKHYRVSELAQLWTEFARVNFPLARERAA
jgi:hypothetical protein